MPERQCQKCGETTDEAKAFCPACGEAFVEETKRSEASVFESMEGTMQLGNTMYNQLLSDMGLNLKARSDDVTEPSIKIPSAAIPTPAAAIRPATVRPESSSSSGDKKWLIVGIIALALFFLVLIALGIAGYVIYRSQAV